MAAMKPLFIVGAPRSGTTMLTAMFASHEHYAAGPETQFFSKLPPALLDSCIEDEFWPKKAVAALSTLTLANQPVIKLFGTDANEIETFLANRTPSVQAMLEALTLQYAIKKGKPGWAEKTPNHLLKVPTIRKLWPQARIIRIMRDPRDAALSMCKLPTFSDSFTANIYLWRQWQDISDPFFNSDPLSATIRYESLVSDPAHELSRLCERIGISYDNSMLQFGKAARDVSSKAETWKNQVSEGISSDRIFSWKSKLKEDEACIAEALTHEYLVRFGYINDNSVFDTRKGYRMTRIYVENREHFLQRSLQKGVRWLPTIKSSEANALLNVPPCHGLAKVSAILQVLYYRSSHWLGNFIARHIHQRLSVNRIT